MRGRLVLTDSPCISVCKLNKDFVCIGCFRTTYEVAEWPTAFDERRIEILKNCKERKELFQSG